jgi:hypothetical protein
MVVAAAAVAAGMDPPLDADARHAAWFELITRSKAATDASYADFVKQCERHGWQLGLSMLNPKETRLVSMQLPPRAV